MGGGKMVAAVEAIADMDQTHRVDHLQHLALRMSGMVGEVELHHAAAQFRQALRLRVDLDALGDRRRTGGRRALAALDLDETEPAGAESFERVGGAQLRYFD